MLKNYKINCSRRVVFDHNAESSFNLFKNLTYLKDLSIKRSFAMSLRVEKKE